MRRWTIGGLLALLLSVGLAGDVRPPPAEAGVDVGALIDEAAGYYGMAEWGRQRAHRVAWCESRLDPTAYNWRSGATGVFQFIPATARAQGIDPWNASENVYAAVRLMAAGQWGHWAQCL